MRTWVLSKLGVNLFLDVWLLIFRSFPLKVSYAKRVTIWANGPSPIIKPPLGLSALFKMTEVRMTFLCLARFPSIMVHAEEFKWDTHNVDQKTDEVLQKGRLFLRSEKWTVATEATGEKALQDESEQGKGKSLKSETGQWAEITVEESTLKGWKWTVDLPSNLHFKSDFIQCLRVSETDSFRRASSCWEDLWALWTNSQGRGQCRVCFSVFCFYQKSFH